MNKLTYLFICFMGSLYLSHLMNGCTTSSAETHILQVERTEPVDLVNPLIDAANSRWFFFSSACRPFGMVNLSPDNLVEGTWGTGYRYNTDTIRGFSHVHAWQLSGVSVMPVTGDITPVDGPNHYFSKFSHDQEIVRPGYHKVLLNRYDITAELTSTTRVGFHRYTFPKDQNKQVIFNLGGNLGPALMTEGKVRQVNDKEIEGYTVNGATRRRPKATPVFFVARFSESIEGIEGWKEGEVETRIAEIEGKQSGAMLKFAAGSAPLLVKVGISYVSEEQARLNLEAELDHWSFDQVVSDSREDWNDWLSKIEVEGGAQDQQIRFYTDLWHALQGRRIISDANGKYSDMTGPTQQIKQIPLNADGKPLFNHYNSDSFWGAQWTLNTLWHLVYPKVTEEFCQSMLMMYDDGGLIPRGPSGGNYTYVMTGASSTPFFVSAYMKGIGKNMDWEKAYEALKKNHLPGGMMSKVGYEHNTAKGGGIEAYMEKGYVPYPLYKRNYGYHQDGAGQTLENAYQDWSLAQLAKALGKTEDYQTFVQRAANYQNLYDSSTGWMRPKDWDGNWLEPFDPLAYDEGWVEATAAASTWFVPHDVSGLAELMGGNQAFIEKLEGSFELASEHNYVNPDKDHRDNYLNYGNQPSMQTGHMFTYVGAPWKTQYWIREVIDKVYSGVDQNSGYSGDEDQGLMGALAVLMKMGVFSLHGGVNTEPIYEITSPIFDKVTIHLDPQYYSGKTFVIEVENQASEHRYIQSALLDGQPLNKAWMYHKELVDGGKLVLELGPEPQKEWGSEPEYFPPSMSTMEH